MNTVKWLNYTHNSGLKSKAELNNRKVHRDEFENVS